MTNTQNTSNQIHEIVTKNSSGIIALPANPSMDAVAAATALYLALTKLGKTVTLASDTTPSYDVMGADKIQDSLAVQGDNLVISFPYVEGAVDKVDYNIQNNFFNLVITPRPGEAKLATDKVQYSYTGGKIEFLFVVDAPNLAALGKLYAENQSEFQGKTIINIDRHLINDNFGLVNIVNKTSSSTSELMLKVLKDLQVELDRDIATNLYAGLSAATNNFTSYSVNAETFEAAATLLRAGATKKAVKQPGMGRAPFGAPRGFAPTERPAAPAPMPKPSFTPETMSIPQDVPPIEEVETEPLNDQTSAVVSAPAPQNAPQDWLKPKIFRGTGLI